MKHEISTEQMNEYLFLKSSGEKEKRKCLETTARLFIKDRIKYMANLVNTKKYSKSAWLEQYNLKVVGSKSNKRIDELCTSLGYVARNLNEDEKAEVGFILLCDYLRELHKEYANAKSCVNCKHSYRNISREGEVLHLFFNPLTLKDLKDAYSIRRTYLVTIGTSLSESLSKVKDDEILLLNLNEDIENNNQALKTLKALYENLKDNWELKVDPLVPYLDDRKVKDLPLSNEILKGLSKKPASDSSSILKTKLILPALPSKK
jgi:hypothetical protein